jgi:succinate dehydrogenase / fumarate reductase, cytochrome b subunit
MKTIAPTTVAKELLAAATGLALILFVVVHLGGNFLLFWGPQAFNSYAEHLHASILLPVARVLLLAAFLGHAASTLALALDNRAARSTRYAVAKTMGGTDFTKRSMLYTGVALLIFVLLHLCDFALRDKTGAAAVVPGGQNLGVYGLVFNSFSQPSHVVFYVLCVWALGLHLSNVISTLWVTLGVLTDSATARVNLLARAAGLLIALGFTAIPLYVFTVSRWGGV